MGILMKYTHNSRIDFGKYKGEPIWTIIKNDPDYIKWCLSKKLFRLTIEAKEMLEGVKV